MAGNLICSIYQISHPSNCDSDDLKYFENLLYKFSILHSHISSSVYMLIKRAYIRTPHHAVLKAHRAVAQYSALNP